MAVNRKMHVRTVIMINSNINEEVNSSNYLGYTFILTNKEDVELKMIRFNQM
jgi:hypothetical protein